MDPYIEAPNIWSDFHGDLAAEMRAELNHVLQPRYVARLTPHVTYEIVEIAEGHNIRPDIGIWQPQPPSGDRGSEVVVITARPVESAVEMEVPLRLSAIACSDRKLPLAALLSTGERYRSNNQL
jgi:hypothetical protein